MDQVRDRPLMMSDFKGGIWELFSVTVCELICALKYIHKYSRLKYRERDTS